MFLFFIQIIILATIKINAISYCSGGFKASTNGSASICLSDANNQSRLADELECIFPFYSNNDKLYSTCALNNAGKYWCSLTRNYTNLFATCQSKCPLIAQKMMQKSGFTHSLCQEPPNNYVKPFAPNQTEIKLILNLHNQARSQVGYPNAINMRQVYWDISLASTAQAWVEYLAASAKFEHDCNLCRSPLNNQSLTNKVGQNLFAYSGIKSRNYLWKSTINGWFGEKKNFVYANNTMENFDKFGHYLQIEWAFTSRIGCGFAQINGTNFYLACNYADGVSNIQRPYKNGTSCSACPNQCVDNLCTCNKYCQNHGIIFKK